MSADELAGLVRGSDCVVFTAGSNGGARETTKAIDGDGVVKALKATKLAAVRRFALVSVMPESWRERELSEEVEYDFRVKKEADVAVSRADFDWLILRPSLLLDRPGSGLISLGPAETHDDISREDVAATLAESLHDRGAGRQILELNRGATPLHDAVLANSRAS